MVFFPQVLQFSHSSPGIFGIGSLLPFWRSDPNNFFFFFFFPPHQSILQSSACSLSLSPPSAPSSPHLSLSLFYSISVLHHIIFITSHRLYVIVMPTIFQAPNKLHKLNQNKSFSFIFPCFWLFICCLSVILWPDNGDFAENVYIVCPC